jgi:tetratricopeptide (TPR) repeat protein
MLHVILSGCIARARSGRSRGKFTLSLSKAGAFFSSATLLFGLSAAAAQVPSSACTELLQAQDAKAVAACKAQLDEAESGPVTERMARIVADDEYGVALLAIAHQPKQALDPFDRGIALLPASTVKPDSLQWAVAFWHRATAYQQLGQWEQAAGDLGTAEDSFTKGIAGAVGNAALAQHLTQLRQRVRAQRADVLDRQGKHSEAQSLRATQ